MECSVKYTREETFTRTESIWLDGSFVAWDEAKLHLTSAAIMYSSVVFEGIRVYKRRDGSVWILQLKQHLQRLLNSAQALWMDTGLSLEEMTEICVETVRINNAQGTYLRPVILRGPGEVGVNVLACRPLFAVAFWDWGKYLGPEALEKGVRLEIAKWRRPESDVQPMTAKSSGNYLNGQLVKIDAIHNGFADGIILDRLGNVCEGSGMNIFYVRGGVLYTPPLSSCILLGCTRDLVFWLAKILGLEVREQPIPMMMHTIADEVFVCGSASEITPVVEIDHHRVGHGTCGPITRELQQQFFAFINGTEPPPFPEMFTQCIFEQVEAPVMA